MKLLTITIYVTVIVIFIVGGCGCSTINTRNQTPSTSQTATRDALLDRLVNLKQQSEYGNSSNTVQAWNVTWNNDTSVTILETVNEKNVTVSVNDTFVSFPTIQDATNYLSAFDKTNYTLTSANYSRDPQFYTNATGHSPSAYTVYAYLDLNALTGKMNMCLLIQTDNVIENLKGTLAM